MINFFWDSRALIPALVLVTPLAYAQGVDRNASVDMRSLEEVIVSARRRNETLTSVPASITAYSADFMDKQNIQTFTDYITKIPNVTFQYGQGGNYLWTADRTTSIRGVVGAKTTAYYINDTPVPSSVSPLTLNLEQIEVLKGPQGTLFGASSMGGNMRFITKKPSLTENTSAFQVSGGSTKDGGSDFDGNGQANFVLVPDRVGLDVGFGYMHESGYVSRRFPDSSGKLITKDEQGGSDTASGSLALRFKVSDSLEATASALVQSTEMEGLPAAYVPLPGFEPVSYTSDRWHDIQEYADDKWGIGSFVLDYVGEGFSVVSSTSYFQRSTAEREDDSEGLQQSFERDFGIDLGNPASYTQNSGKNRLFTQEIRLSFDEGLILPKLSGIVGVYYQRSKGESETPPVIIPALEAITDTPYIEAGSGTSHGTDKALFGEIYYEITPKLTATLGLRQYSIKQVEDPSFNTGFFYEPGGSVTPGRTSKESGLVPKAVLSYEVGDSGNVYASASRGFRPGGSGHGLPGWCSDDPATTDLNGVDLLSYESDTLWSYELGAKSLLANGRVNAAAAVFQVDWSDMQQNGILPCGAPFITNAGKARLRGAEVEIGGRPFEGVPLSIQFGLGYVDSALTDPGLLPQEPNSSLTGVPAWSGSLSGYYETPLNSEVTLFVAADYSYTDSVRVADREGGFLDRPSFNLVNGNIGIRFGDSELTLYAKNLFDKRLNFGDQPASGGERQEMQADGSVLRLPRAVVSRPRQIGLQYQMMF